MTETDGFLNIVYFLPMVVLAVIAAYKRPFSILSIYLAQPWITNSIYFQISFFPTIYLTYILLVAVALFAKNGTSLRGRIFIATILFVLYILASFFIQGRSEQTVGIIRTFLFLNVLPGLLIVKNINTLDDFCSFFDWVFKWLLFFNFIFLLKNLFVLEVGDLVTICGVTMQYSNSALLLVFALVYQGATQLQPMKRNIIVSLIVSPIVLIMSNSRAPLLGLAPFLWSYLRKQRRALISILGFFLIVILLALVVYRLGIKSDLILSTVENLNTKLQSSRSDDLNTASANRILIWAAALNEFITHPIFGVGLGNSLRNYIGSEALFVHNFYLDILSGTGIIGGLFVVFIVVTTFIYLNHLKNELSTSFLCAKYSFLFFIITSTFRADWGPVFLIPLLIERYYYLSVRAVIVSPLPKKSFLQKVCIFFLVARRSKRA